MSKYVNNRGGLLLGMFGLAAFSLVARGVWLQHLDSKFLLDRGNERYLRTVEVPVRRGMITDRNNEPLAVSTQVFAICANPKELSKQPDSWAEIAKILHLPKGATSLKDILEKRKHLSFIYLERQVLPNIAEQIDALKIKGVWLKKEYRRYYPASEAVAHVVGFTNIDDTGLEGVELSFNKHLSGTPGLKRVIKDGNGSTIEDVESIKLAHNGEDLTLSIDKRIQYVAYRELKRTVADNRARGGSVVILDAYTGEILAMANQPSFNPNNRRAMRSIVYRNQAVTDAYEPGSTMKPIAVAAAIAAGKFKPYSVIDTRPGILKVSGKLVRDQHNYGLLDISGIIQKSSNIGAAKIALSLKPQVLWDLFNRLGFGMPTESALPGEASGFLRDYRDWRRIDQATLAFGYGLSVSTLQLAQAYMVFAADGNLVPVSITKLTQLPEKQAVLSKDVAQSVRKAMETVVLEGGTGQLASVPGYRVAGKTGTVYKQNQRKSGYSDDRYRALFAGMIPARSPRLVAAIMIDEPSNGQHLGGSVAAPMFAKIMREAVRLMEIPPDGVDTIFAKAGGVIDKALIADGTSKNTKKVMR